jgi:TRAP transporter TAXI family solute receptor
MVAMHNSRSAALCVGLIALAPGGAAAQSLTVTTTASGSLTHSLGSAVAKVVTETTDLRLIVQPQGGNALNPLNNRVAEFGFSNTYDVVFYVTGTGEYQGRGAQPNIRVVARMLPNLSPMLVKASSDVKTVKDLKGKRIPGGFVSQRAIRQSILAHLVNAGLSYGDVNEVLAPNIVKSADDFMAGKVDAFTFGLGTAKVKEVTASVGPLRALPMETEPAAVTRMRDVLPGAYMLVVEPAPIFPEITQTMPMMAFDMALVTNVEVPDETVYKVVKTMHTRAKEMADTFAGLRRFKPDAMAIRYDQLTYHPGAIRYYQEIGQWPPKEQ